MLSENRGTFYPNPNSNTEPWIEHGAFEGMHFRIWHIIFIGAMIFIAFVILICCCIRIRIPRTKQEIEADYRRKQLTDKFQQRLKLIQNQDMDVLDLKAVLITQYVTVYMKALDIIREDYRRESLGMQPIQSVLQMENDNDNQSGLYTSQRMQAAPQELSMSTAMTGRSLYA